MLTLTKLAYERFKYFNLSDLNRLRAKKDDIIRSLNAKGYYVIDNFWAAQKCEKIKSDIDKYVYENKGSIQWDASGTDARITGSEYKINGVIDFHADGKIGKLSETFYGENTDHLFTLAARMRYSGENLGSGNGWHRDSFAKQFKAMLYLSNVEIENGPFQYVQGTNNFQDMIRLTTFSNARKLSKRYSAEQVNDYLRAQNLEDHLCTFTGQAGSLILFDSSGLHRGSPILKGDRYALTIYAMRTRQIDPDKYRKFGLIHK